MPNIRIMNWTIASLSWEVAQIPGMVDAIARTVVSQQVDILILPDIVVAEAERAMNALATRMNALAPGEGNDYKVWCLSHRATDGRYGFIIRDLNTIRPVQVTAGPTGEYGTRIQNLFANTFATWPGTYAAVQNGYGGLPNEWPWQGPSIPLIDLYAAPPAPTGTAPTAGGNLVGGAHTLGTGHRPPCMALFEVRNTTEGASTLLPVVVCRYTGDETLAAGQLAQLKDLHIAQHFNNGQYINLNGAPALISEIIVTGDFNVDFRGADPEGTPEEQARSNGYRALTPTVPSGGSATPAAAPGAPRPVPGTQGAMRFPFNQEDYPARVASNLIPQLSLRVAVTTENTHYLALGAATPPTSLALMRDRCYDNFIYGGTRLNTVVRVPCPAGAPPPGIDIPTGNAGLTVDPANNIRLSGDPDLNTATNGFLDVRGLAQHYTNADQRGAREHPRLIATHVNQGTVGLALTIEDRWVGAKLISDHLPIVIQFNLP